MFLRLCVKTVCQPLPKLSMIIGPITFTRRDSFAESRCHSQGCRKRFKLGPTFYALVQHLFGASIAIQKQLRQLLFCFLAVVHPNTPFNTHHQYSFARLVSVSGSSASGESRARSLPIARQTPFFTVPVEQFISLAISSYDIPS